MTRWLLNPLALASLLCAVGCVHIRLHTAIGGNGSTLRTLNISMDERYLENLEKAEEVEGQLSASQDLWTDTSYVHEGSFHRVLTNEHHDVTGISDRELQSLFGQWIELNAYERSDLLEFDIYRAFPATSYSYRETFTIRPSAAAVAIAREESLSAAKIEIAVDMPGELLESPAAARIEENRATWSFSDALADTTPFVGQVAAKSGRTNFWHFLIAGTIAILILSFLPGQFRP